MRNRAEDANRWTLVAIVALAAFGCGARRSPAGDGAPFGGDARVADGAVSPSPDAEQGPGGCVEPPGGCHSDDDCEAGSSCVGCGPDPCCPDCRGCYGRCIADDCTATRCRIVDDCCTCGAFDEQTVFERCEETCEQPMCAAIGITSPIAYCLAERCLLAEGGVLCSGDADCALVNDCCTCAVLPQALAAQRAAACAADCLQPSCDGQGLQGAVARCEGGLCRLAWPTR